MPEIFLLAARPCEKCDGLGKTEMPESEAAGHPVFGKCPACDGTGRHVFEIPIDALRIRSRTGPLPADEDVLLHLPLLRVIAQGYEPAEKAPRPDTPLSLVEDSARQACREKDDRNLADLFREYSDHLLKIWNNGISGSKPEEIEAALVRVEMAGDEMVRRARKVKS